MQPKVKPSVIIYADTDNCNIHFCYEPKDHKNSYNHAVERCSAEPFSDDFFEKFASVVNLYKKSHPKVAFDKTALVLPNSVICTDIVSIPTVRRVLVNSSLALAINSIYSNSTELKFSSYLLAQNKQTMTFGLVGVRADLLNRMKKVLGGNQINLICVTYAANCNINWLLDVNNKLRTSSFLYMGIRQNRTDFVFTVKGQTSTFYSIDIGYEILTESKFLRESDVLDHYASRRLIYSALENTRRYNVNAIAELEEPQKKKAQELSYEDIMRKMAKLNRNIACENFKIFKKWALSVIASNYDITQFGEIDTVYVNIPEIFDFVFEKINEGNEEGDIKFENILAMDPKKSISAPHSETYGGIQVKQFNRNNNL